MSLGGVSRSLGEFGGVWGFWSSGFRGLGGFWVSGSIGLRVQIRFGCLGFRA